MSNIVQAFLIVSVISLGLLPVTAAAETVVRTGSNITIDESQVVAGDYYVSVGPFSKTTMSGTVEEDMYAIGGVVTANGSIGADLAVVGGGMQLHATVTDDVRLLVGEATIADAVGGDVFVIGGSLEVLSTADIAGNLYFFGGTALIDGHVGGSVLGTMERLRIDGRVDGDINVTSYGEIDLGNQASIQGDISYKSLQPLARAPQAVVEGEVQQQSFARPSAEEAWQSALVPLFVLLFGVLSLYLLFRKELLVLCTITEVSYARATAIGFGVLLLGPVITVILLTSVLGLLMGVLAFALGLLLLTLGLLLAGTVFGYTMMSFYKKDVEPTLLVVTLGTVALYTVSFIPIIGPAVVLAFVVITVGGLSTCLYRLISY